MLLVLMLIIFKIQLSPSLLYLPSTQSFTSTCYEPGGRYSLQSAICFVVSHTCTTVKKHSCCLPRPLKPLNHQSSTINKTPKTNMLPLLAIPPKPEIKDPPTLPKSSKALNIPPSYSIHTETFKSIYNNILKLSENHYPR